MSGIVVAVSGGRRYSDDARLNAVLDRIHRARGIRQIIEGGCPVGDGGADERTRKWAKKNQVNCLSIPPKEDKYGWPSCGPRRNREMGQEKIDLWVFFPGDRGTADARSVAVSIGCEILEIGNVD